ncbi:MAG TPA: NADP-dependent isocitrate dehydrogenase [Gammaproteobacteria bacterium]
MYETGVGGSVRKHVQQLLEENHLSWNSLDDCYAIAVYWKFWSIKRKI